MLSCQTNEQRYKKNRQVKQRRDNLRADGICYNCGKNKPEPGRVYCQSCCDQRKEDTQYLRERHICTRCRKNMAVPGMVMCGDCAYDNGERAHQWYEANRERATRTQRLRYQDLKRQGLCVKCGQYPAAFGHVSCVYCLAVTRERAARKRSLRSDRRPDDCRWCNLPRVKGYSYCEAHLKIAQENGRKSCEKINANRKGVHPWERDNNLAFKKYRMSWTA